MLIIVEMHSIFSDLAFRFTISYVPKVTNAPVTFVSERDRIYDKRRPNRRWPTISLRSSSTSPLRAGQVGEKKWLNRQLSPSSPSSTIPRTSLRKADGKSETYEMQGFTWVVKSELLQSTRFSNNLSLFLSADNAASGSNLKFWLTITFFERERNFFLPVVSL